MKGVHTLVENLEKEQRRLARLLHGGRIDLTLPEAASTAVYASFHLEEAIGHARKLTGLEKISREVIDG
ncbi:MAG: hypothetical protein NWE79_00715 [Candidatus Bathyarchaeota archaeon]|nr:hypothetical protein [Candidatus Bathyarchaeota archaeon]